MNDETLDDSCYTAQEAAEKLGVTEQRVRQLCESGELAKSYKKNGRWLIPRQTVHDRFAVKPPRVAAYHEGALQEARLMVRELAEKNRNLAKRLAHARRSEESMRRNLEDVSRKLNERERELQEERERLERYSAKVEELSGDIACRDATTEELKERLKDAYKRIPLAANAPRLLKDSNAIRTSRRQGPSGRRS